MKRVLICLLALLLAAPFAIAGADTNPMTALKLETEQSGDLLIGGAISVPTCLTPDRVVSGKRRPAPQRRRRSDGQRGATR